MPYSPGPWTADKGAVKAFAHGKYYTVALVDKKKFTPEGREGNARLIAAAPEMLEVLTRVMGYANAGMMSNDVGRHLKLVQISQTIKHLLEDMGEL